MNDRGLPMVLCVDADAERGESVAEGVESTGRFGAAVATPETAAERLSNGAFDCVVVGRGEDFDSRRVIERLPSAGTAPPVVVFAADGSERAASDALGAGATDYVRAADGVETLVERVDAAIERARETGDGGTGDADDDTGDGPASGAPAESVDRYRRVFEEALDAMVIADDEGRYLDANRAAADLFGVSRSEMIGATVSEFVSGDVEGAWTTFSEAGSQRGTVELVGADGERRAVEYAAVRDIVPGEHLSVLRDVTEREERRAELERQNERLERFAGVISHDLRNPLSTAEGYLELAEETGDSEYFRRVTRSHERMERIIDDLLFLAREGREIGTTEPVDVADIVVQAWGVVADGAGDAELVVADGLGMVEADDDRFRQLLENVLRNAIEHGGEDVTVRVVPTETGVAIEDDGPGISAEDREVVFEHGYSTREDGTGFGLHIVGQVADAHGWSVRLSESDAGGARVELDFRAE